MFRAAIVALLGALAIWAQPSVPDASPASDPPAQTPPVRPKAVQYSDAYALRRKIHKYASLATVPLFVGEFAVGQKLYSGNGSESLRAAHTGLAAGIGVLFGVNSVTGLWNLRESRRDPNGRTKRLIHGILMLGADAGFVATAALAPGEEEDRRASSPGRASTHRAVALTSMGIAAAGYIYMLIAR